MNAFILHLPKQVKLRYAQVTDDAFFRGLYNETRDDLSLLGTPLAVMDSLLALQYKAQCDGYQKDFPHADCFVIEYEDVDCGRLIINQNGKSLRVVDVALVKTMRGRGIGTMIFKCLQHLSPSTSRFCICR